MNNQPKITKAIVLTRVNFQEADRIITAITPYQGKVRVIARGVRKSKSKMAGGVELFSINELQYIPGRGDISTLRSSRLISHFGNITKNITKTLLAYEMLRLIHKDSEDASEEEYFTVLADGLKLLNEFDNVVLIELWFMAQLVQLQGRTPNVENSEDGSKLKDSDNYTFDYDNMLFKPDDTGVFNKDHIKLIRAGLAWPLSKFCKIAVDDDISSKTVKTLKKIHSY